jgi:hypothetical protein
MSTARGNFTSGKIKYDGAVAMDLSGGNTYLGKSISAIVAAGFCNVAIGDYGLMNIAESDYNVSVGSYSLTKLILGDGNVSLGYSSLVSATYSQWNTAIGEKSLYSLSGKGGTIASFADYGGTVAGTVKATTGEAHNLTSGDSIYIYSNGYAALYTEADYTITVIDSTSFYFTTTWNGNTTALWYLSAVDGSSPGTKNVALGAYSGYSCVTGSNNIFLGWFAGYYETGSNVLLIHNNFQSTSAMEHAHAIIYGVMATTAANQKLTINALLNLSVAKTPASAGADGTRGDIAWDANYVYVCTATNTWKRAAISTW